LDRKGDKVTSWRKLHTEELHNLHSSSGIIRIIKTRVMGRECSKNREGEDRNSYRILVENPEENMLLGRPRLMYLDNIKLDLRKRQDGLILTEFFWFMIGSSGGLLWTVE
jgi:hypothetical protein